MENSCMKKKYKSICCCIVKFGAILLFLIILYVIMAFHCDELYGANAEVLGSIMWALIVLCSVFAICETVIIVVSLKMNNENNSTPVINCRDIDAKIIDSINKLNQQKVYTQTCSKEVKTVSQSTNNCKCNCVDVHVSIGNKEHKN